MTLPTLSAIDITQPLPAPNIEELTTGSVDGTGVFDVLMQSTKAHLMEEYEAGRISGAEYTTVYLGALSAVLQQSVAYLLSHQQKEKVIAEIGLIRQQTVTELTQTDDTIPVGLGFNGSTAVEGLVKSKKDLEAKQIEIADTQAALTGQQIITELAKTDDTISSEAMAYALNGTSAIEGITASQKAQIVAEVALTNQKTITELAQTDDITCSTGIIGSQKKKIDAETDLTIQKTVTELVQTDNDIPTDLGFNNGVTIEGLIKTQIDLSTQKIASEVKQTELINKQIEVADTDVQFTSQKIITEIAQTDDVLSAAAQAYMLNSSATISGLVGIQRDKVEMEKERAESESYLTKQKVITEIAQTDDTLNLAALTLVGFNSSSAIEGLIGIQRDKVDIEKTRTESEVKLTDQKIITEIAQTDDTLSVAAQAFALNTSASIAGLVGIQRDKVDSEIALTTQKIITEKAQTEDASSDEGLAGSTRKKTDAEVILLAQKAITELAQTSDAVVLGTDALNTSTSVTGITKAQKDLFVAQKDGFTRDAEQKLTKMVLDTWSVRKSIDSETPIPVALEKDSIQAILVKAKTGIGVGS